MLRHTFLLIYRNFQRFRSTFFINLIGLSSGLTCALLIFLWVNDELSVDKFHENDAQLYQVLEHQYRADGIHTVESTAGLLAESLAKDMPEVVRATAVAPAEWFDPFTLSYDDQKIKASGQFASPNFFQTFSYELIQGDASQVLADKSSIVISQDLAQRMFGSAEDAVGKTLEWNQLQFSYPTIVSGVFKNTSAQSSRQFELVLSFETFKEMVPNITDWGNHGPRTYLILQADADTDQFNRKIEGYYSQKTEYEEDRKLFARSYSDGYLYGTYENGVQAGGRIEYVRLFSIIAMFILMIACINFMNLSTAKASRRVKEVGIKKAVGASRATLVTQYLSESFLMSFLSLLTATVLVGLLLPQFNLITGKQLSFELTVPLVLLLLGIVVFTGLLAGSYPALYLSSFNPVAILKGNRASGKLASATGELWARKGLVVFQFALSVILIVSVWVVYQQITFVQDRNLGYDKDNVISFPIEGEVASKLETFLTELRRVPGVVNAANMNGKVIGNDASTVGLEWEGKNPNDIIKFQNFSVGYDFIETLGLEIADGRSFSRTLNTDSSAIIFNEAAIKVMGLTDPVGKTVNLWGDDRTIVGVVKDFHFESLHQAVNPMFFKLGGLFSMTVVAKVAAGEEQATLARLQDFYQKFNPGYSFDYQFVDADYQALYAAEQRVSTLSKYFAGLAILISCLGLFGLAAFTAERRLKEIGIRKILGASNLGIVRLLSGDFTKMVLVAILIALPVSYFVAQRWLEDFAFSIDLQWWYFAGAGAIALFIAWFTVGLQTVKAARVNPAECLRDE